MIQYDALGRRTLKYITNSADWDRNYHYFYDGQRLIEERQLDGVVAKQYVWGTQYVDELVEVAVNTDPYDEYGTPETCEAFYYAMQDANYNVLGVVAEDGGLTERYEYTPYGQRSVFASAGTNDTLCKSPVIDSQRANEWLANSLCDFAHALSRVDPGHDLDLPREMLLQRAKMPDAHVPGPRRPRDVCALVPPAPAAS